MDTFAIGDFATLDGFKVAKSPIAKVSIRLLVLKISYPKRKLFRSISSRIRCNLKSLKGFLSNDLGDMMM